MGKIVGIDASRNRSGGAKAHIRGLLSKVNPKALGISEVHIWSYQALLDTVPDYPWLIKHSPRALEKSLLHQLWWQYRQLQPEAKQAHCDVMFFSDAGTVARFDHSVVMSQSMLPFDKGERWRFGFSLSTIRLMLLRLIHSSSMSRASAVVFLTQYASKTIQNALRGVSNSLIIPHGVSDVFKQPLVKKADTERFRCLYVSHISMYKHQWQVIHAIAKLRKQGFDVSLELVGAKGRGKAQKLVDNAIRQVDPEEKFVHIKGQVDAKQLPTLLNNADLFIFASSCENMPITLLEGMSLGLPIACSERGPMPEVLEDGGVYFNPESSESIADAIKALVIDSDLRQRVGERAKQLAEQYTWERCARETWTYLKAIG